MNAEQEARARKTLRDSRTDAQAVGNVSRATSDVTNRTYADALKRDYLGRRGRDMFSVAGSLSP